MSEAKPDAFVGFRTSTQPTNQGIFHFGEGIEKLDRVFQILAIGDRSYQHRKHQLKMDVSIWCIPEL